ncbi:hypothetical protein D3C86_1213410 [compost metagenome]
MNTVIIAVRGCGNSRRMASHSVRNAAINTLKMYTQVTPSLRAQSKKPRRHSREYSQRKGAGKEVI